MGEKPVFFMAKNLSVNTWRSGPDICSLICGLAMVIKWRKLEIYSHHLIKLGIYSYCLLKFTQFSSFGYVHILKTLAWTFWFKQLELCPIIEWSLKCFYANFESPTSHCIWYSCNIFQSDRRGDDALLDDVLVCSA